MPEEEGKKENEKASELAKVCVRVCRRQYVNTYVYIRLESHLEESRHDISHLKRVTLLRILVEHAYPKPKAHM